ncbi:MAG: plastocyanin/azurin family copper-binding protein [Bernardetiaceae bacterium]|nr:plastocyanin/azurin family copper-binding protein [Bernardetiaceae bacterium]
MKTTNWLIRWALGCVIGLGLLGPGPLLANDPPAKKAGPSADPQPLTENDFYQIVKLPIPDGVSLEVGGLAAMPDGRIALCTRRGDVWLVQNPTMESGQPHYKRFAQGLHEPLGLAYKDGALYTCQRGELTKLVDKNGDDVADVYQAIARIPISGNYHEYTYGPLIAPDGSMFVTTNVGFSTPWWLAKSFVPWRGWTLKVHPDGRLEPFATGMRSPCGIGFGPEGEFFYADNQGDWIGSGFVTMVEKGDFAGGNPAGLAWATSPDSPVKLDKKTIEAASSDRPQFELAQAVKELKTPAVWLPHSILGISTSEILAYLPREGAQPGGFGPFEGQLFVGDQGQSKIMRVALEKVKGRYQGVAFLFREGFSSGVLRMEWASDGSMLVGQTNRGWGSTGPQPFALERLKWTGKIPFEMKTVRAMPDGFEAEFTQPVDLATAQNLANYQVTSFIYSYHWRYGSPVINKQKCPVRGVQVSPDGLKARFVVDGLRQHYIHEIMLDGVKSATGQPLLHNTGYYTLNELAEGAKLNIPLAEVTAAPADHQHHPMPSGGAEKVSAKRTTAMPASWGKPEVSVSLGTRPGLVYDQTQLQVQAGSKVKIVFNNVDDMPHNFVLVAPGKANEVGQLALKLGIDGPAMQYVPNSPLVLYHTNMVGPGQSEAIFFTAPDEPGEYMFVCTYPGHAFKMQGIMKVVK